MALTSGAAPGATPPTPTPAPSPSDGGSGDGGRASGPLDPRITEIMRKPEYRNAQWGLLQVEPASFLDRAGVDRSQVQLLDGRGGNPDDRPERHPRHRRRRRHDRRPPAGRDVPAAVK